MFSKQASKSGFLRISHPDFFRDPRGDCPDFSASHIRMFLKNPGNHLGYIRNNPDSPFRIRTNSDIPEVIARISSHFTSGFSGQIRISHPDKFGYPRGDCPDFFGFHIRIFRTSPDFASGQIRISPWRLPGFSLKQIRISPDFASGQIRISVHPRAPSKRATFGA